MKPCSSKISPLLFCAAFSLATGAAALGGMAWIGFEGVMAGLLALVILVASFWGCRVWLDQLITAGSHGEAEEAQKQVFDRLVDGASISDFEGNFLYVNPAFENLTNLSLVELL